jgi:hypothetical protein
VQSGCRVEGFGQVPTGMHALFLDSCVKVLVDEVMCGLRVELCAAW